MDDPARIVAAGYDSVADRYAALEPDDGAWPRSPHVAAFTRLLPPGASVLHIGCGVPVARSLAAAGFAVTGVDVSEEQVRRAREAVPRGSFLVGDVRAVVLPESAFDAALCIYSLDHVPRDDHPEVYERIAQGLRPGGHVLSRSRTPTSPASYTNGSARRRTSVRTPLRRSVVWSSWPGWRCSTPTWRLRSSRAWRCRISGSWPGGR